MRRVTIAILGLAVFAGCGDETKTVTEEVTVDTAGERSGAATRSDSSASCDSQGINNKQRQQGTCTENGIKLTVVERDRVLRLRELNVRLLDDDRLETLENADPPDGKYLVLKLAVTNKTTEPQDFAGIVGADQVGIFIDKKRYSADTEAAIGADDAFGLSSDEIQPDATRTGTLVFDLPDSAIAKLDDSKFGANFVVINFSDLDEEEAKSAGIIRLYR